MLRFAFLWQHWNMACKREGIISFIDRDCIGSVLGEEKARFSLLLLTSMGGSTQESSLLDGVLAPWLPIAYRPGGRINP